MFLLIGLILFVIALFPYIVYLTGISLGRKSDPGSFPKVYPNISIIISAYNEEAVVEERVKNIEQCNYPKEFFEIIFIDDCSSDNTNKKLKSCLEKSSLQFRIISNTQRMGTNRNYNYAIKIAKYPIIVTTDADVFFEPFALNYLIGRLMSDEKIAAVTGELRPRTNPYLTMKLEEAYRSFYGRMCDWESTIDSTYNFNGALVAFRSDLIRRIDDKRGSDDANTAFEAIRQGYRAVYEKKALVYEDIPIAFKIQYRQKIRRATRLIEATLANLDLLTKKREFSRYIYPLRIFMYLCTPCLFFISIAFLTIGLLVFGLFFILALLALAVVLSLFWKQNIFVAFIVNQFFLMMGLLKIGHDMRLWESTSKKPTR